MLEKFHYFNNFIYSEFNLESLESTSFFSIRPSKEEVYLMSLGVLNSYQAQYLLSLFSFSDIMKLKTEDIFTELNPEIINIKALILICNIFNSPVEQKTFDQ